ncbi:MAG: hypothetical protein AAFN05_12140, partial [Pseudomonadota bacterium]
MTETLTKGATTASPMPLALGGTPLPVAFYAPMKAPDHPVPSGDREIARHLFAALTAAGAQPVLASSLRVLDLKGDAAVQAQLEEAAAKAGLSVADAITTLSTTRVRVQTIGFAP